MEGEKWSPRAKHQKIIELDDIPVEITGYSPSRFRTIFAYLGMFLTCGLLRLVFHWFPHWMLMCMNKKCSLLEAQKILVKDAYGIYYIHDVIVDTIEGTRNNADNVCTLKSGSSMRSYMACQRNDDGKICYFMHKCLKYIWNNRTNHFEPLRGWHEAPYKEVFYSKPLNNETVIRRRALYGINEISISLTPIIKLLLEECFNPFYCFQIFSCILWYSDEYWMYATCIVVISVMSLSWQVYELRRNERTLKETMCISSTAIVCREEDGTEVFSEVDSSSLVPGDLIEIPRNGCLVHCDAVLLAGNCIVNESTLTGESVPVTKVPLPDSPSKDSMFDIKLYSRHILFAGTTVIQTRNYADERVMAVVVRTGFNTIKGELVRSILFPKPLKFKFTQDAFRFVIALSVLAIIGLAFSVYLMVKANVGIGDIILRALDLVTIVVPPALPVVMTVGIVLAQRRLRSSEIFCVNPSVINVCGVINVACFDKTGTLTEDGLDMWGIIPYEDGLFGDPELDPSQIEIGPLMECLATCHSLTLIEGVLSGDPVDLKMFQSTKWEFIEEASDHCKFEMAVPAIVRPSSANSVKNNVAKEVENDDIPYEVGILRQFPFSSSLQRMSVIARALNRNHFSIYTKGAPETIEQLCRCDTIPSDFHSTLLEYTREGYRVLALAWKPLKANYAKVLRVPRERVEQDLLFLGLLIMENRLKPETTQVIQTLRYANIRPVMVTGDNMLTALSVARDCEMIDELDRIILVSAKPPPSSFHQSSDIHVVANNPTDASIQSSNNITSNQQNIYCVNPTALSAHMIQPEKSKPHGRSSFNATASSLYQEKFFEQQLQQQQQDDSLVEFHYAEDLHRPVTEVTATTETSPTRNYKSQRATTSSSSTTEKDISHSSLREFKKSRKWMRRICKGAPCLPSDSASHSTPASSPLTDVTQVPNVSLSDQSRLDSSAEQKHQHKNHQYQPINGMSCLRGRHQSTPVKTPHPVSIRMLDRPDFHLAMSGKTWAIIREHYPWLIPKLVVKGTVFARFLPEQKAQLIEALQSVGYFVSMCGDGANDCGALKVAHAGIALSEAEASVASPFTSKQQNISCVLTLIREGRCALTTSFGAFKFMVGYSMIQFFSAILLYYIGSNISDFQFLYIDFFLITTLGLTFGYTPAYPRLSVEPPGMRLLSTVTLLSLGLQLFTCALIQFAVFTLIRMQPWYLPLNTYHEDYELLNYESTAVFTVSVYQYIILAIVFSKGAPYRRSIFSNYIFLCNVAVCVGASLYLTTHPTYIIRHLFELCRIPSVIFILILHGIALGNLLFGCILESIVDGVSFRQRIRHIRLALFPRHVARKDYERIRDEIDRLAGVWPPIIRSASVQALPRELFNEANVNAEVASQLNYSRKRYNSGLSTDSEDNDNDADDINNGDNVSISCHMKAQLYNPVNDTATTPTHFLPTSDNPPKSVIENNPTRKKRTRSTSSHRRHSFHTGDLDRKEAKRSTSREDAPKQHASIVSKISDDEHVRSHSGRRHDAHYNKQHIVDAQPQLNAFHSSTNC